MLSTIKIIISRKCLAGIEPLVATNMEVYAITGKALDAQIIEAMPLAERRTIKIGETFNGVYYRLISNN